MGPYIQLVLPSYTIMAFIGGLFALLFTYFRIDKFGVLFTDYIKILLVCIVGGFIGGKALFILTQIPWLIMNFSVNNMLHLIIHSGIVFYGGLFGVLLALKIYIKFSQYEVSTIYRMIAPAIPLFHGFGRIGCLFAGCCYGRALSEPIVLFNAIHIDRIPTQLFEVMFEFMLFAAILVVGRKHKEVDLLRMYLLSYAVFRFANEFFRGDKIRGVFLLSTSQWISVTIMAYYVMKWLRKPKTALKKNA